MSNHFSADKLKFPGDDRRLDLTDLFVFPAPADPEHHHSLLHRHHPGKTARRLPDLIKDMQLVVVEGGPHAIPWTHADQVNTALLDFLRA